jgi:hypothetical protein
LVKESRLERASPVGLTGLLIPVWSRPRLLSWLWGKIVQVSWDLCFPRQYLPETSAGYKGLCLQRED